MSATKFATASAALLIVAAVGATTPVEGAIVATSTNVLPRRFQNPWSNRRPWPYEKKLAVFEEEEWAVQSAVSGSGRGRPNWNPAVPNPWEEDLDEELDEAQSWFSKPEMAEATCKKHDGNPEAKLACKVDWYTKEWRKEVYRFNPRALLQGDSSKLTSAEVAQRSCQGITDAGAHSRCIQTVERADARALSSPFKMSSSLVPPAWFTGPLDGNPKPPLVRYNPSKKPAQAATTVLEEDLDQEAAWAFNPNIKARRSPCSLSVHPGYLKACWERHAELEAEKKAAKN